MERQRLTAKLAGLEEIVTGRFVLQGGFQSSYVLTRLGRRLSRARVLGVVVDKFESSEKDFGSITLDDGVETLRAKVFVNTKMLDGVTPGELVDVIGKLREYNSEIYIMPESIRKAEPNFEILRMLELKKIKDEQIEKIRKIESLKSQAADIAELKVLGEKGGIGKEDIDAVVEAEELIRTSGEKKTEENLLDKEKVLKAIDELDSGDGADYSRILEKAGLPDDRVDSVIEELLESGICIEPRAGKIKKV